MKIASLPNQSVALLEQLKQWFEINENNKGQIVLTPIKREKTLYEALQERPFKSNNFDDDDFDEILTAIRQQDNLNNRQTEEYE